VVLNDSRSLVGQLLAFDKHMNLVLAECDEFRRVKRKGQAVKAAEEDEEEDEMKRTLGLVILRGETIVTLSGESGRVLPSSSRGCALVVWVHAMFPKD
jgi:small nuclear ribonucleoprotein B and B'